MPNKWQKHKPHARGQRPETFLEVAGETSLRKELQCQLEVDKPRGGTDWREGGRGRQVRGRDEKGKEEGFSEGEKKNMKVKWKGQLVGLQKDTPKHVWGFVMV